MNKRVILFNYPGQSHTIYDSDSPFLTTDFNSLLDKLMYRLSGEKSQLGVINMGKDIFKFIGVGYGCSLLASFLSANPCLKISKSVMLVNGFQNLTTQYKNMLEGMLTLYTSNDPTA